MIGQTISHYKILEKLGEGGMGVVYKAQDTKLDRFVALKFLPPALTSDSESKERFIHEAKAASALDHNNICAIHEIDETEDGQMYIVMACYEGEILKDKIESGPLKLEEAVNIAIQIAKGLEKAHKKEIVHRDIKPGNIFITHDDVVKIVDFGLAKLKGQVKLTKEGTTLGTAAYMSPESARGSEVDYRTDIWSLGIVLYEMLAGKLPFRGEYEQAVTYSILNEEPEPITALRTGIPMELERIANKCLAKEPERRYQQVQELIVDLKEIRERQSVKTKTVAQQIPSQKSKIPLIATIAVIFVVAVLAGIYFFTKQDDVIDSIAVLPLINESGNPEDEIFVNGMHGEIINKLFKIGALRTINRTSVMQYKETTKSTSEIAEELNVKSILEGSFQRFGERLRFTVRLTGVKPERLIWAETFDREPQDILALYNDVASAVAHGINVTLTPEEEARLEAIPVEVNPEAYDLYLRGWYFRNQESAESIPLAVKYLEAAVALDPNYGDAWAALAVSYGNAYSVGIWDRDSAFVLMFPALDEALELNTDNVLALMWQGLTQYFWRRPGAPIDIAGADVLFRRALDIEPTNIDVRYEYGLFLMRTQRLSEAIAEFRFIQEQDPTHSLSLQGLGQVYDRARQYNTSREYFQAQLELVPDHTPRGRVIAEIKILMLRGQYKDAAALAERRYLETYSYWDLIPFLRTVWAVGDSGTVYAFIDSLKATGEWQRMEESDPFNLARYNAFIGERDEALYWIENIADRIVSGRPQGFNLIRFYTMPEFDFLRAEPRFKAVLQKLGLPEVFDENGNLLEPLDETLEAYNAPGSR